MEAIVSIARRFEGYPIARQLCLIFRNLGINYGTANEARPIVNGYIPTHLGGGNGGDDPRRVMYPIVNRNIPSHLGEGNGGDNPRHVEARPIVNRRNIPSLSGGGNEGNNPSHVMYPIVDEITKALTQPNIIILGMYGSSDARKHELMEFITRRVERDEVFDVIVMTSVVKKKKWWRKSPDVKRIQEKLGNQLDMRLNDKTTLKKRASCLCDKIKTKEKILIILDDLWCGINLAKIGIPFGNDHKGCKILLVSHTKRVLSNQMNTPHVEFCVDTIN